MQKQVNCNPKILLSNSEIFLRVHRTLLSNKTGSESVRRVKSKGQWWLWKQSSVHSGYVFGTQISLETVFFSLKSDKSAKQYKLGQVLSWLLIYFWKTSHRSSVSTDNLHVKLWISHCREGQASEIHLLEVSEFVVNSKTTTESRRD